MSDEPVAVVQPLYDAINGHDPRAILGALDPGFVGIASAGMPCGVGGRHEGPEAMLTDCWGVIFRAFDIALEVEELLATENDRVVVLGRYVGTERVTGRPVDAAFAHVLRVAGGKVTELRQITDTARWGFEAPAA